VCVGSKSAKILLYEGLQQSFVMQELANSLALQSNTQERTHPLVLQAQQVIDSMPPQLTVVVKQCKFQHGLCHSLQNPCRTHVV